MPLWHDVTSVHSKTYKTTNWVVLYRHMPSCKGHIQYHHGIGLNISWYKYHSITLVSADTQYSRPIMKLRHHTWVNWFVSPICLVGVPSTLLGPIVCWYCPLNCLPSAEEPSQSPDSPFATFYRTVWSLLRLCRPSVSVWKHICSRPRSLTLSSTPLNYSPTFRGRWSGFITWTTHDWLNCNGVCRLVTLPRNCVYALFWGCAVVSTCVTSSLRRQRRARSNIISAP